MRSRLTNYVPASKMLGATPNGYIKAHLIHEIFALALDGGIMLRKFLASPLTIYILLNDPWE
jgi:hypothetical protein